MQKFILVDHSISGTGGHYLEYARNVLHEAEKSCETYLVTNRLYTGKDTPCSGKTFALYPYDCWGRVPYREKKWEKVKSRVQMFQAYLEKKALFTSVAYFILGFKSGCFFMYENSFIRILVVLEFLVLALLLTPFALVYIAAKLIVRLITGLFGLLDRTVQLPANLSFQKIFSKLIKAIWSSVRKDKSATEAFYAATRKMLRKVRPERGDIIFIPTLSLDDTRAVSQILRDVPAARAYHWVLLFRRNLYEGRDPGYQNQLNEQLEWRKVFSSFIEYGNVRFLTDTEQLTDQYQTLGVAAFETAPIPMNPDFQAETRDMPERFQIVYAGDARTEKGYQFLPSIVEQFVLHNNTEKVTFRFQSNFAFREVRDDPAAVLARDMLEAMGGDKIQLLKRPVSSAEYVDLVSHASAMPLLYDRNNYYARSSGALAEALAAGIPVVVPSASWLSQQIMPLIIEDQLKLQKRAERISYPVEYAIGWYSYTDMVAAQTTQPKGKKKARSLAAVNSLINWDLMRESLSKKKLFSEDRLPVMGAQLNPTNLYQVPKEAKALFLRFRLDDSCRKGAFVRTTARFYNDFGWEIDRNETEHCRIKKLDGVCTAIFRFPEKAKYVRLELSCPYDNSLIPCLNFRVEFWRNSDFALGGNGCIYVETDQVYDCLVEIQQHFSAYWNRAQQNAVVWNRFHSAKQFVRMLLEGKEEADYDS